MRKREKRIFSYQLLQTVSKKALTWRGISAIPEILIPAPSTRVRLFLRVYDGIQDAIERQWISAAFPYHEFIFRTINIVQSTTIFNSEFLLKLIKNSHFTNAACRQSANKQTLQTLVITFRILFMFPINTTIIPVS